MKKLKQNWVPDGDNSYALVENGKYLGFVEPTQNHYWPYRVYDSRFSRNEFGKGFLGVHATLQQAKNRLEEAYK